MLFHVVHTTGYHYVDTAMEAYLEVRLTPPVRAEQEIVRHRIEFLPAAQVSDYLDYFGNQTTFYSMTLRHRQLKVGPGPAFCPRSVFHSAWPRRGRF